MDTLPDLRRSTETPSPFEGAAQIQRPHTGTPSSNRPLPARYLQDSAFKLGNDSLRSLNSSRMSARKSSTAKTFDEPSRAGSATTCATARGSFEGAITGDGYRAESDADMWRKLFHAEAFECVQAMQAVIEKASLSHCSSRFDDWRKFDLRATAQMQQHVKEVMHLNDSLAQFLNECATPDDFAKFKGSVLMLTEATNELADSRKEICKSVEIIAERASAKVIAAWESDNKRAEDLLLSHTREQHGRWVSDNLRWSQLETQLSTLREQMDKLGVEVQQQSDEVNKLVAAQSRESSNVISALQDGVKEMQGVAAKAFESLQESFNQESAMHVETFKRHNFDLLVGAGIEGPSNPEIGEEGGEGSQLTASSIAKGCQHPSVHAALRELDNRLLEWDGGCRKDAEQCRQAMEQMKGQLKEQMRETQILSSDVEQAQNKAIDLERILSEMKMELENNRQELKVAHSMSMHNSMKRLKDIEGRGNIKVNRQTGAVTMARIVEFAPCKPAEEPCGKFADPHVAAQVLKDLAQIANAFEVSSLEIDVRVKVGRGGAEDFWEHLAESQATLVREHLEMNGFPSEKLTVKGLAGNYEPECLVRLDNALFPEVGKAAGKAKAKPK